jgi:hypothetical protein
MIIAGVDPGKTGAIVVIDTESSTAWFERLKYGDNGALLTRFGKEYNRVDKYNLELIRGRGGWGATQIFGMGRNFGQVLAAVVDTGKPYDLIRAEEWTGMVHRNVIIKGKAKEKTLSAYYSLFPHDPFNVTSSIEVKGGYSDGLVDALFLAAYDVIKEGGEIKKWQFKRAKDVAL